LIGILTGVLIAVSTVILARAFGANGIVVGYACISLTAGLAAGTAIFVSKRREWHRSVVSEGSEDHVHD
jgi:ABC-type uncharacterized transport system permease subunit